MTLREGTITSLVPTSVQLDGAVTSVNVLAGSVPINAGDRVVVDTVGQQLVVIANISQQTVPDTRRHFFSPLNGNPYSINHAGSPNVPPYYGKTAAGEVYMGGTIESLSAGSQIFQLPPTFRPSTPIIVACWTTAGTGWIEIDANGMVSLLVNPTQFTSLNDVHFMAEDVPNPPVWLGMSAYLINGYTNWGAPWPNIKACIDRNGVAHYAGLIKTAATGNLAITSNLPAGYAQASTTEGSVFLVPGGNGQGRIDILPSGTSGIGSLRQTGITGAAGSWLSLNSMFVPDPSTMQRWVNLFTLGGGWAAYGGSQETPAVTRDADGMVSLKGLIKSGTASTTTVVTTLPGWARPDNPMLFACDSAATGMARVDIHEDGTLFVIGYYNGGTNGFVSLSNIRYRAGSV